MSTTDNSDDMVDNGQGTDRTLDRRGFVRNALGAAALAAVPSSLTAQGGTAAPPAGRGADTTPPRPLGNGDPPAMVFQPYPGGTGSYHVLVPQGLVFLYHIDQTDAVAFTFIFHGWQTINLIVAGVISLIITTLIVKKKSKSD